MPVRSCRAYRRGTTRKTSGALPVTGWTRSSSWTADSNERWLPKDLDDVLTRLEPVAKSLDCADELAAVADIPKRGASYQRQRRVAEEHDGDLRAVVDALVGELEI